jgi:predicted kinase
MKKVIITVGIPGSGKSTWVKEDLTQRNNSYIILNADSIRKELYGNEGIQGNGGTVFQILNDRIRKALINKKIKTIYIDNTSTTKKARKSLFDSIEKNCPDCEVLIKVFNDFELAKKQNQMRDRVVPDDVMERMIKQFEIPSVDESTLNIKII